MIHEKQDLGFRIVALALGALLILMGVVHLVSITMNPRIVEQTKAFPPKPRLQADPARELTRLRESEDVVLKNYGWVDRSRGIVHVPISDATELYLQRQRSRP